MTSYVVPCVWSKVEGAPSIGRHPVCWAAQVHTTQPHHAHHKYQQKGSEYHAQKQQNRKPHWLMGNMLKKSNLVSQINQFIRQ